MLLFNCVTDFFLSRSFKQLPLDAQHLDQPQHSKRKHSNRRVKKKKKN